MGWRGTKFSEFFGPGSALIWDTQTGLTKLDDLLLIGSGWKRLICGEAINERGQIAGYGVNKKGQRRAFLITPRQDSHDAIGYTMKVPLKAWDPNEH